MSSIKVHAILATLPLFKEMGPDEIDRIAQSTRESHVSRGEIIFQRGDPSHGFYVVIHGQLKLAFSSPQGVEKVVHLVGPGKTFGEAVMFMDMPYPVYAQAIADSALLHISRSAVFEGIERDPVFSRKMLAGLSSRLHSLIGDVEAYSLRSCTQRVIGYLLQHGVDMPDDSTDIHINLPASKTVIASRLNISPETFSRILHDLSASGMISVKGKDVAILDIVKLREYGQQ
ncbi:MAG: Crp/Fnr family transcriptional regulator [Sulfuricella sp.]|nr:Crp/Fnr family transcriptional regulator [Sulfuricella sp.]